MKRVWITILAFAAVLMFTGIASAQAQVDHGMKVYTDQKCSLCHSVNGKGNAKGKLDGVGARLKVEEIREWIVNSTEMAAKAKADRKPPMKAYASLPKDDLDALVAYVSSLKK